MSVSVGMKCTQDRANGHDSFNWCTWDITNTCQQSDTVSPNIILILFSRPTLIAEGDVEHVKAAINHLSFPSVVFVHILFHFFSWFSSFFVGDYTVLFSVYTFSWIKITHNDTFSYILIKKKAPSNSLI